MRLLPILNLAGRLLMVVGLAQALPLAAALFYREADAWRFLQTGAGTAAVGGLLYGLARRAGGISTREAFGIAACCWALAALAGAVPFYLMGAAGTLTDAVFEAMAGFTTTGASVLMAEGELSHSLLLWRSLMQWIGGMGILLLALFVLPAPGGAGAYGPRPAGKVTPRLWQTARRLWLVYVLLTGLEAAALALFGMSPFDAVNYAMATLSTGGFGTGTRAVGEIAGPAVQWTILAFMLMGGANFTLHYRALLRKGSRDAHLRDLEWKWFVAVALGASLTLVAYLALAQGIDWPSAAAQGAFQVVSILTTTGFHGADYSGWEVFPQLLLMVLMVVGGCTGSTSGGIKMARVVLVVKFIRQELLRLVHPKLVVNVKLGPARITPDTIGSVQAFLFLYLTALASLGLLLALDGNGFLTSLGTAISALGNVGPALGAAGAGANYEFLSTFGKWVVIAAMLLGRLELMAVLVLFNPRIWRA